MEKITKSPCENAPNFNAFREIMNDKFYFNRLETSESIQKVQSGETLEHTYNIPTMTHLQFT